MPISEAILIDNLQYMAMMPDKRFSIGVPDPNYGLKESLRKAQSRQNLSKTKVNSEFDWDNAIPPRVYFSELKRVTINQIIWGANYFPSICGTPFKAPRRSGYAEVATPNSWPSTLQAGLYGIRLMVITIFPTVN